MEGEKSMHAILETYGKLKYNWSKSTWAMQVPAYDVYDGYNLSYISMQTMYNNVKMLMISMVRSVEYGKGNAS